MLTRIRDASFRIVFGERCCALATVRVFVFCERLTVEDRFRVEEFVLFLVRVRNAQLRGLKELLIV